MVKLSLISFIMISWHEAVVRLYFKPRNMRLPISHVSCIIADTISFYGKSREEDKEIFEIAFDLA